MRCVRCGKKIYESYHGGAITSVTDHHCKECAEELNRKDMEILEAIKRGENVYKYIINKE